MDRDKASQCTLGGIVFIKKSEKYFEILYETGEQARLYVLNSHVFRYYMSPSGIFLDYPEPLDSNDKAKINVKSVDEYDCMIFKNSFIEFTETYYIIHTNKVEITFDKIQGTMRIRDNRINKEVLTESLPISYEDNKATQTLYQHETEYFFGGGMQNGRFTHKGQVIKIVNTNNWNDEGVSSPCPFYWSSNGYGILRNTWQPGIYDFGSQSSDTVKTIHKGADFDAFIFINTRPRDILIDYYELTGYPIFMPEFAFYEAHFNTFNRDYWLKVDASTPGAILFEDGNYYKSYKPNEIKDKTDAILESLNGEKNNYQFSARAMIDRYERHDMPLGWFIPNDGYGSGYGQTDSLEGDITNLKQFVSYAKTKGVEVALWTESNLEPKDPKNPKKGDRDLRKEIELAGIVALKCDVAWIGSGYSFALNAVEHAADIFEEATKVNRKMIIMVDGWAGTQRHSGIWSGDQRGGQWEYIRFHIPTYIGAGLSGLPVLGSDMDGIYEGGVKDINIRDYQWKTFTPLQLNMDGWGTKPKTPFAYDSEAKDINRAYLKLKSMLMPYNYTIGYEAICGLPMLRAMFLEFPYEKLAYGLDAQYQFMWGPYLLIAPIYNDEHYRNDTIRHGIYLPDSKQVWIDLLTGRKYQGGKILNYVRTPLWKLPVFVKDGAIIPMTHANNNPNEIKRDSRIFHIYPKNRISFNVYEDDGHSPDYTKGHYAQTEITVDGPEHDFSGNLHISIEKTKGSYEGVVKERTTLIRIMALKDINLLKVAVNGDSIKMFKAATEEEFYTNDNVYYFNEKFILNPYLEHFGGQKLHQKFIMIKIQKLNVISSHIQIKIDGYEKDNYIFGKETIVNNTLKLPNNFNIVKEELKPKSVTLKWTAIDNAVYYEIERDGAIFTNILDTQFKFDDFKYESMHSFRIRSVTKDGVTEWSDRVIAQTADDPYKYTVKDVKVTCNLPCQPNQEVFNLTNQEMTSIWHTSWGSEGKGKPSEGCFIKLHFDLGEVYNINKIEYIPREDAGNGTFLEIKYRTSIDEKNWSESYYDTIFEWNKNAKTIDINGSAFRFMEIIVSKSVGDFGSGRQILFYKENS